MKFIKDRILNLPHLFYILIWASFTLPIQYDDKLNVDIQSSIAFIIVLIAMEVAYIVKLGNEKKAKATKDIFGFLYLVLLAWELFITRLSLLPYIFLPPPENVFYVFVEDYKTILQGFGSSMFLLVIGLVTALAAAIVLGTLIGFTPRLVNSIYPIVKAVSTVPPLIYTPYVVLIMPTFRMASIFVIFLSVFWGTLMGSMNNTAFVEKRIINSAKVLNLSTASILFKIIIPFNFPRIINGLPINLATAIMTLTAAEMIGANVGMGFYVRYSLNFANYAKAIAGIIFIGIVVTGLNAGVNLIKKKFVNWEY